MAGSRLASDPAPTSAFSAGTFLPAASRHCLWKPTEDPPHSEWDVLTGVVLWSSLIGSQFSILAPGGKASSRGWGSWEPQVVYLLGRLRFPGTSSASCIPLGPPLALVCIFFALPFLFAPVSRLLSTTSLSPSWSPAPFSLSRAPPLSPPPLNLRSPFLFFPLLALPPSHSALTISHKGTLLSNPEEEAFTLPKLPSSILLLS